MSLRERVRLLRKELCDEVIVELDRLEADISRRSKQTVRDAEKIERMKEALSLALKEIKNHNSDYHHHTFDSTIQRIEAAIACRPQGERSETCATFF